MTNTRQADAVAGTEAADGTSEAGSELDARVAEALGWPVIDAVESDTGWAEHPHKEDEEWFYDTPSNFPHVLRYAPWARRQNGWQDDRDESESEFHLYLDSFEEPCGWSPSTDMNDAMRAAEAAGLFEGGVSLGKPSDGGWVVYEPDLLELYAYGDTPALAIARAVVAVASQRAQEGQGEGR